VCGDVAEPGRLVAKPAFRSTINTPYDPRQYHGIKHILHNNLLYIGNILALDLWYRVFRAPFILYWRAACPAACVSLQA